MDGSGATKPYYAGRQWNWSIRIPLTTATGYEIASGEDNREMKCLHCHDLPPRYDLVN